jgi:hypothetical protein
MCDIVISSRKELQPFSVACKLGMLNWVICWKVSSLFPNVENKLGKRNTRAAVLREAAV